MMPHAPLTRWLIDDALPFWAQAGRDDVFGGVHERLFFDGSPDLACPKRLRVQARQIYCYAHASVLGWHDGVGFAGDLLDWMLDKGHGVDGRPGFVHVLNPDGSVADARRDTYDHAFVLLALGWYAKASSDSQALSLIDTVLADLDEAMLAPDGSYREGLPATLPRRQNPHMHLFEAMLALHEAVAYPGALARAKSLHAMLETRFLRPAPLLREFFDDAWNPIPGEAGRIIEPGHQAEWCWLLRRYETLLGLPPAPLASRLIDAAESTAEAGTGFLIDEADDEGRPKRRTRRLWPQTEWAKACLSEQRIGRPGAQEKADRALKGLGEVYLGRPLPGGWIDQFDENGQPATTTMPASSLYHIFGVAVEAQSMADRSAA